jgi:essential nuclear protein 1
MKQNVKKKDLSKDPEAQSPTGRPEKKLSKRAQKRQEVIVFKNRQDRPHHAPLHEDIASESGNLRVMPRCNDDKKDLDTPEVQDGVVDAKSSKKILNLARIQLSEIMAEEQAAADAKKKKEMEDILATEAASTPAKSEILEASSDDEGVEPDQEQETKVNSEDEAVYSKYLEQDNDEEQVTLADKIMAKIREKETGESAPDFEYEEDDEPMRGVMLPEKVIAVYVRVGELLSRYRSGKLPKAFKIIPTLSNWEDVLYVTQPETWSAQAVYEATKFFISTLPADQAQKFVQVVLLDRFKAELDPNAPRQPGSGPKVLNQHIYNALKKSLYKPAAFFRGFLLPLTESASCSPREAVIASSILVRVSIPALHSAVALMHLAENEYYTSCISVFIKVLLEKKYALPYKVIDALVFHFLRFRAPKTRSEAKVTIVWHQSFLAFAQTYKNDITEDQRDFLLEVLKVQTHPAITPEIRRELLAGHPQRPAEELETASQ